MQTRSPTRIVFLSVPESLRGELADLKDPESGKPFIIDPSIPIPVALEPGAANLDIEHLSWEMILSGMIRVVSDNPDDEDAPYYRRFVRAVKPNILTEFSQAAAVKTKNGDYPMALEITDALTGLFPQLSAVAFSRAFILEEQANALEQSGQEAEADAGYDAALQAYQKALALPQPFPPGLFNAGFFYMKRRNYDLSLKYFQAYLDTPPTAEFPEDKLKRKQTRHILEEIEKHSLTDEDFRDAYDCIRRGEPEQGLKKIRRFLERHSDVWNGWFVLGWALRKLGRWEDGEEAFRKTVELGGGNSDTRNELAICLMEQGDLKGARKELELCLRQEPDNVKIISNLGVLALKSGNNQEAAGFFRAALELEPQDPVAREYFNLNPAHTKEG